MVRGLDHVTTFSGETQVSERSAAGKFRSQTASNRRAQDIHPKDSDLVVDSENFRVI